MENVNIYRENEAKSNKLAEIATIFMVVAVAVTGTISMEKVADPRYTVFFLVYMSVCILTGAIAIIYRRKASEKNFPKIKYFFMISFTVTTGFFIINYSPAIYIATTALLILACRYNDRKFMNTAMVIIPIITIATSLLGYFLVNEVEFNLLTLEEGFYVDTTAREWVADIVPTEYLFQKDVFLQYLWGLIYSYGSYYALVVILLRSSTRNSIELMQKREELVKEKVSIEKDLEIATNIQLSLLPEESECKSLDNKAKLYALMKAAKEVGGDLYDFIKVDDNHICFMIGDVSGKGVPAALYMSRAITCINGMARLGLSSDKIIEAANNVLAERNNEAFFVTVWLGILDVMSGEVEYVVAGHNPPLVSRADGSLEYLVDSPNLAVGILEGTKYSKHTVKLCRGDKLILYTDGVTEAVNQYEEQFGEDRLRQFVKICNEESDSNLLDAINNEIRRFAGDTPQYDDITMVSIEYLGQ